MRFAAIPVHSRQPPKVLAHAIKPPGLTPERHGLFPRRDDGLVYPKRQPRFVGAAFVDVGRHFGRDMGQVLRGRFQVHRSLAMSAHFRRAFRCPWRVFQDQVAVAAAAGVMHDHVKRLVAVPRQQACKDPAMRAGADQGRHAVIGNQPGNLVPEPEATARRDQ